jgi:pyridoxine 5-phosphate synthase
LEEIVQVARHGAGLGLEIHAGHGLDYFNVRPVAAIPELKEFSIGFAIVARAAIVGIDKAVREIIALIE